MKSEKVVVVRMCYEIYSQGNQSQIVLLMQINKQGSLPV